MYNYRKPNRTLTFRRVDKEGETIEQKLMRITKNKEPIKDATTLIYTERKDGVLPGYNIRTDRFEIAAEVADKLTKGKVAKRDSMNKVIDDVNKMKDKPQINKDGKPEPIPGEAPKPESK